MTLIFIALVQPVGIYLTIRRTYKSSNQLQEASVFEITPQYLKINGESYFMEIKWEKFYEIVERPKWFLLYQNSLSALMISKINMSPDEIHNFRQILKTIKEIPVELMEADKAAQTSMI